MKKLVLTESGLQWSHPLIRATYTHNDGKTITVEAASEEDCRKSFEEIKAAYYPEDFIWWGDWTYTEVNQWKGR